MVAGAGFASTSSGCDSSIAWGASKDKHKDKGDKGKDLPQAGKSKSKAKGISARAFLKLLEENKGLRKQFRACRAEFVRLKATGRSRVSKYRTRVSMDNMSFVEVLEPEEKFVVLKKYKSLYGCPKKNKAKVVYMKNAKRQVMAGVIVRVGDAGIYPLRRGHRVALHEKEDHETGNFLLDEDQVPEAVKDALLDMPETSGILSVEETKERAATQPADSEDEQQEISSSSEKSDDENSSDSDDDDADSEDAGGERGDRRRSRPVAAAPSVRGTASRGSSTVAPPAVSETASVGSSRVAAVKRELDTDDEGRKRQRAGSVSSAASAPKVPMPSDAAALLAKLDQHKKMFSAGKYDDARGKELVSLLATMRAEQDGLAKLAKKLSGPKQLPQQKEHATTINLAVREAEAMMTFLKHMCRNGTFSSLSQAWAQVTRSVPISQKAAKLMVLKHGEHLLAGSDMASAIQLLSKTREGAGTMNIIEDRGTKQSCEKELILKLVAHLYPLKLFADVSMEQALLIAETQLKKISEYVDEVVKNDVKLDVMLGLTDPSKLTEDELDTLVATATAADKNDHPALHHFLLSKVGKHLLKKAKDTGHTKAKDAAIEMQLEQAINDIKKRIGDQDIDHDGIRGLGRDLAATSQGFSGPVPDSTLDKVKGALADISTIQRDAQASQLVKMLSCFDVKEDTLSIDWVNAETHMKTLKALAGVRVDWHKGAPDLHHKLGLNPPPEKMDHNASSFVNMCGLVFDMQHGEFKNGYGDKGVQQLVVLADRLLEVDSLSAQSKDYVSDVIKDCDRVDKANVQICYECMVVLVLDFRTGLAEHVVTKFNPKASRQLAISHDDILTFVGENGALRQEIVDKITALDVSATIPKYDDIIGTIGIMSKLAKSNDHDQLQEQLKFVVAALPIVKAVVDCHLEQDKREEDFLFSFTMAVGEVAGHRESKMKDMQALYKALTDWSRKVAWKIAAIADVAMKEVNKTLEKLDPKIIDVPALLKDYEANVAALSEYPHRQEVRDLVKSLNGASGGGIKRLEAIIAALKSNMQDTKVFDDAVDRAKKVRGQGRLMIVARATITIIQNKRKADIDQMKALAKQLNTKVPQELQKRLDSL